MATRKPYWEKLRDPRWQKKRLEIMERDKFKCCQCGDMSSTLNVHHGYYERGLDPWEYDDDTLWTLCERCHEDAGLELTFIHHLFATIHPSLLIDARLEAMFIRDGLSGLTKLDFPKYFVGLGDIRMTAIAKYRAIRDCINQQREAEFDRLSFCAGHDASQERKEGDTCQPS